MIYFLLLVLAVFLLGRMYVKKKFAYFEERNIPFLTPRFPLGNISGLKPTKHPALLMSDQYYKLKGKGPFGGLYVFIAPILLAIDLDFIKTMLVRDFPYFMNRGVYHNEKDDPLSGTLFSIEDQRWKTIRAKLTPTFTSGKMKFMFPTVIKVAEEFKKCVNDEIVKLDGEIEMKEILARFTTDVIGTCAFGIDCNSLKDPKAKFREMGAKVFVQDGWFRMKLLFSMVFPNFSRRIGLVITRKDVSEFYLGAVKDTVEYREQNKIQRNDFMDLLIQLKNDENDGLTLNEIAAQAFVFFLAGFETSSTTMSYALYELSLNHEIQDRARAEVLSVLKKHDGQFTYEAMMEMKYLEQIINESLRKYPPVANLNRMVKKTYKHEESGTIIEKGTPILIPVYAIQHDPDYYENPEDFNPDRFTDEEVKKRNPMTFLPFGEGPRVCIGLRFGMMQAKVGMATLLANFKFSTCSKSIVPVTFVPGAFVLTSQGGLFVKAEKL